MPSNYIDLATLQDVIKEQIGELEAWVKAELDSCSCSGGHWYLGLIQKNDRSQELAKARAVIWRYHSDLVSYFRKETGKDLAAGMNVLLRVKVNYDARWGLSLNVVDIDADYTVGQRELERQRTIKALTDEGLMEQQKELALPFLPGRIAVISSAEAAGYGDFTKQLAQNSYGFKFDCTLFNAIMQGDYSPSSIISAIEDICEEAGAYDLILIMRGGGAQSDMFCFDDCDMCRAIANCPVPVLTAIGHDRDFHIADMVANAYFKTPTALAAFLVDWVADVEAVWTQAVEGIRYGLSEKIAKLETETRRCVSNISFAFGALISNMEHQVQLLGSRIDNADPRSILRQGYVLAADEKGNVIKSASAHKKGDSFRLRFNDGSWNCGINEVRLEKQ